MNPRLVSESVPRLYQYALREVVNRSIQSLEQAPGPQLPPAEKRVSVDVGKLGMEDKLRDVFRF